MSIGLKIFLSFAIIIALAASILVIYQGQSLPILNRVIFLPLFEKSTAEVVAEAADALERTTTATYQITTQQQLKIAEQPFSLVSTVVHQGQLYPLWRGTTTMRFEFDLQAIRFRTSAEVRATDEWIYVSFQEFPAIPFIDIHEIDDRWYRFPNQWQTHTQSHNPVRLTDYISSISREPDASLNGVTMYQLRGTLSRGAFSRAWGIATGDTTEQTPVVLFIGKDDLHLYRMEIGDGVAPAVLSISEYGQAVSVTEPSGARPFDSIWSDVFTRTNILDLPLFGSLIGIDLGDTITDTDADGLYKLWEQLIGTDPTRVDSDDDHFTDGEELRNGYNPKGSGRLMPFTQNGIQR